MWVPSRTGIRLDLWIPDNDNASIRAVGEDFQKGWNGRESRDSLRRRLLYNRPLRALIARRRHLSGVRG